ncbi:MAG: NAD(+)/NADH kinase [Planctomycetes bacterium]|nr:NAD(+)/NADH kinase [Planctomycetota bacterium]
MPRILLVTKTPLARRLASEDLDRLRRSRAIDPERLAAAAAHHQDTLDAVRAVLAGDVVVERSVEDLRPHDADDVSLVITVGGDGTVFTANTLNTTAPFLTVNSDPSSSIGHFTRARCETVAAMLARWRSGAARIEAVPRLDVRVGERRWRILNDCLLSSHNPAAMTRYLLDVDGRSEHQRSSGVWVATAAGSTAAIHSAGADPVEPHLPALLFRVREPFQSQAPASILAGNQLPPRGLALTPSIPGVALYIDGPNITVPLPPGTTARFSAAIDPLMLVAG